MSDSNQQKDFKKRLKILMNRPENQVCTDCTERSPRWASLIVAPPDAPTKLKIGSFCCLECSGSHRRLGVHITFVRSVNLDSWKEEEVQMMENGGNAKVNAIFEARLAQSGVLKPTNHADLQTRERFIRDKYERRKYYDAAAFGTFVQQRSVAAAPASAPPPADMHFEADFGNALFSPPPPAAASIGPPSDAARRRLEARGGGKTSSAAAVGSTSFNETTRSPKRGPVRRTKSSEAMEEKLNAAPPVLIDLLDFQSDNALSHSNNHHGFAAAPASAPIDLFDFGATTTEQSSPVPTSSSGRRRGDKSSERKPEGGRSMRRNNSSEKLPKDASRKLESPRRSRSSEKGPTGTRPPVTAISADIMALYGSPVPRQSFTNAGSVNNGGAAMMMNPMQQQTGMAPMQNMNQMQAMMQNMNMGSVNNGMMSGISSVGNGMPAAPNLQMMKMQQQQAQNPQAAMLMQQQQMLMYQQQQMMMQQQQQQQRHMPNNMFAPNARMGNQQAQVQPKKVFDPNDPFAECAGDFSTTSNQFR
ncbi:hypothetical protein MPSEU_000969700 [Mayamaea pseudoterrestris]|nr:hypothetical protein MPSEU_000969700 [Mayamaea pseudoterrestris]